MAKKAEVAESVFEYLLCEILDLQPRPDELAGEEDQNVVHQQRLDNLGYEVGYRYVEKLAQFRPLMSDPLDIVKFVCKDFWDDVFLKKIDKLQTNHRGVFVLSDFKFKWLERYASDDPVSKETASRSVVLFLSTTLASAAGIGGGGLTLPVLIIIFGFSFHKSVVLSLCSVLGNTLLQVLINFSLRHPQEISRPLIYWDAILILLPAQLGGSSVGVIVSSIAPETIKLLLAICILCFAIIKTYLKGMVRWEKEQDDHSKVSRVHQSTEFNTEQQKLLLEDSNFSSAERAGSPILSKDSGGRRSRGASCVSGGYYNDRERVVSVFSERDEYDLTAEQSCDRTISVIVAETKLLLPTTVFVALGGLWMGNAVLLFSMGFFGQCDWERLFILSCTFPLLFGFIVFGVKYVSSIQVEKPWTVLESDLNWLQVSGIPPFFTFLIGIICSLLGIGGGELMGPLMLQMGLLPQVVSVTTSVLSFFVTSSSLLLYAIKGTFPPIVECFWIFAIALGGGFSGRKVSVFITWYYNRPSITIFALVGVLLCALGLLIFDISKETPEFVFTAFCEDD